MKPHTAIQQLRYRYSSRILDRIVFVNQMDDEGLGDARYNAHEIEILAKAFSMFEAAANDLLDELRIDELEAPVGGLEKS